METQIPITKMAIAEQNKEIKVSLSRKVKSLLGYDLQTWEQVMLGSLIVAGLSAVAVAFSTIVVVKLQRAENAEASSEFERYKLETGETIAKANERAAEATKVAEGERLARTKLEASLAPRVIVDSEGFLNAIRPFKGSLIEVWVFPAGTPDTSPLAQSIIAQLKNAGWEVGFHNSLSGQTVSGIEVGAKKGAGADDAALALANAIKMHTTAKVRLTTPYENEPNFGISVGGGLNDSPNVMLLIGSK